MRNSQPSKYRRYHTGRPGTGRIWMIFVALGLIIAVFFALKAYRYEHTGAQSVESPSLNHSKIENPVATPKYENLELAKYTDSNRGKAVVRKSYEGFTLSFNPANGTSDWVGWELLASEVEGTEQRSNNFWADTEIEGSPTPADYRRSGYDKGHLCPAADQKWSRQAMNDCFVMTNMTPQDHALNTGAWNTLENKERLWAKRDSALIIVAGPVYTDSDKKRIGETGVRVPSAFFKVFLAPYVEHPRAIGFVFPNMTSPGNMENYSMSVDKVEEITGLDFFSNLPDDLEKEIEGRVSFTEWNRK